VPDRVRLVTPWRWLLLAYPVLPVVGGLAVLLTGPGRHSATAVLVIWLSAVCVLLVTAFVVGVLHEYSLLEDRIEHRSWRGRESLGYSDIAAMEGGVELVGERGTPGHCGRGGLRGAAAAVPHNDESSGMVGAFSESSSSLGSGNVGSSYIMPSIFLV